MKKITVYCGQTITDKCGKQLHPVTEVQNANSLVMSETDEIAYSNSPDFISAIKYIGLEQNIKAEFFLNGVSCGNDIEPIFEDFNRSLDMIHKLGLTEE